METLGSIAELRIVTEHTSRVDGWFAELWGKVSIFNERFSRFSRDSELSLFNQRAGERVPVSLEFKQILKRASYFSLLSGGTFNPFVLPSLQQAGYVYSMVDGSLEAHDYSLRTFVGHEYLELGDGWARIPPGTAIDLGGIGKGYLADELAVHLSPYTRDFCISLGGDIRVSGNQSNGPWAIDVESSGVASEATITYTSELASYGIATSGTRRIKLGKEQFHLIDPRTGRAAETLYDRCTVVAKDATSADVLASCILIEGPDLAERLLRTQDIYAVCLQSERQQAPFILGEGFQFADPTDVEAYNT